jgi:membrane-associated PAP2 superfamily phosphatase
MLEFYRSRDGRTFLKRQTLVLVGAAIALCAIFGDGRLDLALERQFYDAARGVFPLANDWLLKNVLHDAARSVSATAALVLVAMAVVAWAIPRTRLRSYRGELLFAAALALSAAAIVGLLKHFSAHACPWDLAEFGGTAAYHPLLSASAGARVPHGCFPAAHPLTAYAWLTAGFVLYPFASRLARRWWTLAFVLGTAFGAVQVVRGAHFASHVLWSAWVVWAVTLAVLTACLAIPNRKRHARPLLPTPTVQRPGDAGVHG